MLIGPIRFREPAEAAVALVGLPHFSAIIGDHPSVIGLPELLHQLAVELLFDLGVLGTIHQVRQAASPSYGVMSRNVHQIRTYVDFCPKSSLHLGWHKFGSKAFGKGDTETM